MTINPIHIALRILQDMKNLLQSISARLTGGSGTGGSPPPGGSGSPSPSGGDPSFITEFRKGISDLIQSLKGTTQQEREKKYFDLGSKIGLEVPTPEQQEQLNKAKEAADRPGREVDLEKLNATLGRWASTIEKLGMGGTPSISMGGTAREGDIPETFREGQRISGLVEKVRGGGKEGADAAAELKLGNLREVIDNLKSTLQGIGRSMKSDQVGTGGATQSIGGAVGLAAQGIGTLLGGPAMGMAFSAATGLVTKFGEMIAQAIGTIREWNTEVYNANMKFAEFSASMAAVQASTEIQQAQLGAERGERRAGAAQFQADAMMEMNRKLAVYEDAFSNVKSIFAGMLADGISLLVDITETLLPFIHTAAEWFGSQNKEEGEAFTNFFENLQRMDDRLSGDRLYGRSRGDPTYRRRRV